MREKIRQFVFRENVFQVLVLILIGVTFLFQYWMIGVFPLVVALINVFVFFVYLIPGVNFSDWFLAVHRGQTSIPKACVSILINLIGLVLGIASLFALGEIVDSSGQVLESRWSCVYLAAITLTTVGYGNVVPLGVWGEFVAILAGLIGFVGFALLSGVFASVFYAKLISEARGGDVNSSDDD